MAGFRQMLLLGYAAAICLFCCLHQGHCCDEGWAKYGNSCYRIFLLKNTPFFAKVSCASENAKLASISSEAKLIYLSQLASYTNESKFWIGLHVEEGQAEWSDGSLSEHQPYVPQITSQNVHLCAAFNGAKVVMDPCFYMQSYICEREEYPGIFHQLCPAPAFAAKRSNHCILIPTNQTEQTLNAANHTCLLAGSHTANLEEIFHESVNHFRGQVKDDVNYWLLTKWDQLNSTLFGVFPDVFTAHGSGSCMAISFSFSTSFKFFLHQIDCEGKANVICFSGVESHTNDIATSTSTAATFDVTTSVHQYLQQNLETTTSSSYSLRDHFSRPSCPHGYNWKEDTASGFCFWETSYETSKLSWADARAYCQSYGGDLASFHSNAEERIGLSFQYLSASHPYWIGLSYDKLTDTYSWSDGSPLDYTNWISAQPDHLQKRKSCIQMDPSSVHWVPAYCGELCWFICKAPKQLNPMKPVLPTPPPMVRCQDESFLSGFYYDGYCYKLVDVIHNWHRAKTYCEDHDSSLVSVHSEGEANFLIRLMNDNKHLTGNRVWIGLTSRGYEAQFQWSDGSVYDFSLWDDDEPNNAGAEEHCVNMYIHSAFWNDENCYSKMGFICKRRSGTAQISSTTSTEPTLVGNCPNGWYTFDNRCFLIIGEQEKDREDFFNASLRCTNDGGYLASVRNTREQAFMAFLIQNLNSDMWIGLSDRVQGGQYQWVDNSPLFYTNWAHGVPETVDSPDCVFLSYNSSVSGKWRSSSCKRRLPFICRKSKDPSITTQAEPKALRCVYPLGWLKQGMTCYKLFSNESTFANAKSTCESYHANLVSISDSSVEAVVNYLSSGSGKSYWMGLLVTSENNLVWSNRWPMSFSRWDSNQPQVGVNSSNCFVVTPSGWWNKRNCLEKMPFICQVSAGRPPGRRSQAGSCPSSEWVDVGDDYCYSFESSFTASSWSQANSHCYSKGGNLVSLHSMSQLSKLKAYLRNSEDIWVNSYFIGLTKNENGGFVWSDLSAVDFVNWAPEEPEDPSLHCVHMHPETMKWHTTSCSYAKDYICSIKKGGNETLNSHDKLIDLPEEGQGISGGVITAIVLVTLFVVLISAVVVVMYFYPLKFSWARLQSSDRVTSFENALYKTDLSVENPDTKTLYIHD